MIKKALGMLLMVAIILVCTVCPASAEDTAARIDEIKKEIAALEEELASLEQEAAGETQADTGNAGGGIEILKEYTLPDSIGWYTRHFLIVKNNTDHTVDVKTSSMAYGEGDTLIGYADGTAEALGAGCTSILYESFETGDPILRYETDLSFTDSMYQSVIQDLAVDEKDVSGGAVFAVTNQGSVPADFVEGNVLFFEGDTLVDWQSAYFVDSDSQIKPGDTQKNQISSYVEFDSLEVYLTGRYYSW